MGERVSIEGPSLRNLAFPSLGLAGLTMVVSLVADVFPSTIGASILINPRRSSSFVAESLAHSSYERQTGVIDDIDARMAPPFCQPSQRLINHES